MTEQTRRNILRYGIAIDLVILAAGIGLLYPDSPMLLVGAFAIATALSVWRGGWAGGALAGFLSLFALALIFPESVRPAHLMTFIGLALVGGAAVAFATKPRLVLEPAAFAAVPVAVPYEEEPERERFEEKALDRRGLAAVVPLREEEDEPEPQPARPPEPKQAPGRSKGAAKRARAAREREEAKRLEEERQRIARELEAQLARERAEADRIEAERRAAEEARAKAEEERQRIERELEEQLARERAEAERIEAERRAAEEARAKAEEERQRIARELEEQLARERAEAERIEAERRAAEEARARAEEERQRIARELEEQLARERAELARVEAERRAAEEARAKAEEERQRFERELEEQRARERAEAERIEAERRAAEEARALAEAERLRVAKELEERLERERLEAEAKAEAERQRLAKELEERLERERLEAEAKAEAERQRLAKELEERLERERQEAEAKAEAERQRLAKELEERVAREREEARREAERIEAERRAAEEARAKAEAEHQRVAKELEERVAREHAEAERLEAERKAADAARVKAEAETLRLQTELGERLAQERESTARELHGTLEAERRAAEEDLRRQLESEREAMRARVEQDFAAERNRIEHDATERVAAAQRAAEAATANVRPAPAKPQQPSKSLFTAIAGWFGGAPTSSKNVNLSTKRLPVNGDATMRKRPPSTAAPAATSRRAAAAPKPRLLLIERRRGTAETVVPKLRHRGIEVAVVERWVDAVDEIFRFRPSAVFLDIEHPEFDKIQKTLSEKTSQVPLVLTGRAASAVPPSARYAAFIQRPYDVDDISRLAQLAAAKPEDLLLEQSIPRDMRRQTAPAAPSTPAHQPHVEPAKPAAVARPVAAAPVPAARPKEEVVAPTRGGSVSNEEYEVTCFSCRAGFNAVDADWCSCLAKERSLVCTNCLACFCKAPPSYKEKFWVEAPPRLFERKTTEARRQDGTLPVNPPKEEVTRPLVLSVEDDEEIQAIVQRVCSNLGYGFIWANNGQDGLDIAREYRPNLILSDAFMPKLDGREMCRMLKEEPLGADIRMIVMTGLYTDTKYRSEAVKRFHVDDYIAKPVAITDLINLLQRHLEGVTGLPAQEDLHEIHRQQLEELTAAETEVQEDMPLSELLTPNSHRVSRRTSDSYDVACFNCQLTFNATRAEWCSCVGRDNTLVCEHCRGCFCKAPAAYRERFWLDAPPSLFERKMIGSKRSLSTSSNPLPKEVKRPLILLVEDDENVQLIVRTVVSSMGYGFVVGANGQEGLSLAREYNPDLILSDAFMPKLDGREMCRLLKEDPITARARAIIMTGLYTDRKYRNEALDYFKVDDYVAKPLAVDDLIKLFKKHLPQEVTATH
jgi:CheY-like chemotaxis protein